MDVICSLFLGNPGRHRQRSSNILHPNCPFLALKNLTELTEGREFIVGIFSFVIGNGIFVPLLDKGNVGSRLKVWRVQKLFLKHLTLWNNWENEGETF